MFRVSDGGFMKHIRVATGVVADGDKDVQFALNGELLVAAVITATTVCACLALMVTHYCRAPGALSSQGTAYSQFVYPTAL